MVYIDTSALVPIFIREPNSEAVISWIESSGERLPKSRFDLSRESLTGEGLLPTIRS